MPAPARPAPVRTESTAISVPKGIVGVYTDLEVDALLTELQVGGGQAVDLSAYYNRVEVDALLRPLVVDLAGLASNQQTFLTGSDIDLVNSQIQALATVAADALAAVEKKADKTTVDTLGKVLTDAVTEVRNDTYTKAETDAAIANVASGGTVDLSSYATTVYVDSVKTEIQSAATAAFQERYTKPEADSRFVLKTDMVAPPNLDGYATEQYVDDSISRIPPVDLAGYATKASVDLLRDQTQTIFNSVYTREEGDARYASKTDLVGPHQFDASNFLRYGIVSGLEGNRVYVDSGSKKYAIPFAGDVAKLNDNAQAIVAGTLVAKAVGFGDSATPPAALTYTDTGEGYGPRLVFAVGMVNDYVALRSDFDPIRSRLEAVESKSAPAVDLSAYVTLADADARYYTQKQTDDRFIRIEQAFSKADFDNQMALFLYSRKQVDEKLSAISPLGAPSINDPALADFKKSVLDAVSLMLAGGTKQPPPDIGWTKCLNGNGVGNHATAEIRMVAGVMEFRGVCSMSTASGSNALFTYPSIFPLPSDTVDIPVAARLVGSAVVAAYVWFKKTDRICGISAAGSINEYNLGSVRLRAAY